MNTHQHKMTNHEALDKLTKTFIIFLDQANIKYSEYQSFKNLSTCERFFLIEKYLKPFQHNLDQLIIDTVEKYNDSLENYKAEDIAKLKLYLSAFIDCLV